MALVSTFGVMAILLAETLITPGAFLHCGCQGQEAWVPFTDAIAFQSAVVPVVAREWLVQQVLTSVEGSGAVGDNGIHPSTPSDDVARAT